MNSKMTVAGISILLASLAVPQIVLAQDISPHPGLWGIDEENNGKPGRGFQLDVQNDVMVLTFYGYEQSGASSFWLATGSFEKGSNEITMDLGEFEGGMAFGDSFKNATYLGSKGEVTIRFTGLGVGEICLPNESCKAISWFNFGYENSASALLGAWLVHSLHGYTRDLESLEFDFLEVAASSDPNVVDRATGDAVIARGGVISVGDVVCDKLVDETEWQYFCRVQNLGDVPDFSFNFNNRRNAFYGWYYGASEAEPEGELFGFRLQTGSARNVMPN